MSDAVERARRRLAAARTRLVLERPFLGTLTLHLQLEPDDGPDCPTFATDARNLWFNPAFVESASQRDLQFWLAHEAMHCALGHFARRAHRVRRRWDVACDHAVNLLLVADGLALPPGALANPAFATLSAEQIYPMVPADTAEVPGDRHWFDRAAGGGLPGYLGSDSPGTPVEGPAGSRAPDGAGHPEAEEDPDAWDDAGPARRRHRPGRPAATPASGRLAPQSLEQAWQGRLATAAHAAREAGRLGQSWARVLETLLEPQLPWRALLARYVSALAREDYTFQRPARRDAAALLPRLARGAMRVVAVLDTSGSITAAELDEFASELDALKAQVRAELIVHACDERLAGDGPWTFGPWDPVVLPASLSGGGGTRFTPVFEWIGTQALPPDVLVYFTDAQGEFPEAPPPYPVVWLVKGRAEVPFGERIQLD